MKPSIPKGTRDFSPTEVAKRNYIFNAIQLTFENFGFQPIETPAFEKSSTLMGKYGEEGDRLIFKILNSGDYLKKISDFFKARTTILFEDFFKNISTKKSTIDNFFDQNKNISFELTKAFIISNKLEFELDGRNLFNESFYALFSLILSHKLDEIIIILSKYEKEEFKEFNEKEIFFFSELSSLLFSLWIRDNSKMFTHFISEKALRYDLTVPFARYVVQHQNEIIFPFKRYQMQAVWRADRPQKGRFREFYQCDADVVGSTSLSQEVEFVQLYDAVFTKLGLTDTSIKINNRKILSGIAEIIGAKDKLIDFTVALDKLDKIGVAGITKEMLAKGISETAIQKLKPLFELSGSNTEKLSQLKDLLQDSEEGLQGIADLQFVIDTIGELGLQSANLALDITLARGLNYYTGAIFEVQTEKVQIGSIGGGGRYDDLTGIFGLKDMSGIGISFGLDRIYLVLEELDLFDEVDLSKPKVVFLNYDKESELAILKTLKVLREATIKCEMYPDTAQSNKQRQKQWKYVVNRKIEYAVTNIEGVIFTLKNVSTGEQQQCKEKELVKILQNS